MYKKIDTNQATLNNIEIEAAEAFIDMRIDKKKKLTQRAFNQNMNKALKCELEGICSATEAVDIATEKCWDGVTPQYIANHLQGLQRAAIQATPAVYGGNVVPIGSTRDTPLMEDLTDRSWAD